MAGLAYRTPRESRGPVTPYAESKVRVEDDLHDLADADFEPVYLREAGSDPRSYRVDFSRITARVPEFRPQWTIERGARELYDAYRAYGLTAEVYQARFTRLRWLDSLQSALGSSIDGSLKVPVRR